MRLEALRRSGRAVLNKRSDLCCISTAEISFVLREKKNTKFIIQMDGYYVLFFMKTCGSTDFWTMGRACII